MFVRADIITIGGSTRPALVTVAPARVSWPVQLVASNMVLRTAVALVSGPGEPPGGAVARVGISDAPMMN